MTDVVLLGPQRFDPTVGAVVASLDVDGPVATITAGWQEREPEDGELDALLDGRSRNLGLYLRWHDIEQRDPEFAAADLHRRDQLEELQAAYLLRLHHAIEAVYDLQRRIRVPDLATEEFEDAIDAVRSLDRRHRARVDDIEAAFDDTVRPDEREAIVSHRSAVADAIRSSGALAIAGGHVDVLRWCLRLLDVASALDGKPVVAWSAGAMAVSETIVLFHDLAAHSPGHAEVYASGLGLCRDIVVLPHARRRLRLDNQRRMTVLARRFAPSRCVVLDDGVRVDCPAGTCDQDLTVVTHDGRLVTAAP